MSENKSAVVEMFYTLSCPNCKVFQRMLEEVMPGYDGRITFKKTLASGPVGYIKSLKLGIHAVPTVLINNNIVFRSVPSRQELIAKLNQYTNN
ncbi:MAG: thioredoxin family protein [Bacteroidales bacterium]|nr:thioredoxin family protein [Bacteroidales bacterium]